MKIFNLMFLIITLTTITCQSIGQAPLPYFNQEPPGEEPVIFADGLISLPDRWEGNLSFSKDGQEMYFNVFCDSSKSIYWSQNLDREWSKPSLVPNLGSFDNWEPFITLDQQHLYFVSSRPPGSPEWNGRIWRSERNADGWHIPTLTPLFLETENGYWFPTLSANGDLYFGGSFTVAGSKGKGDLHHLDKTTSRIRNLAELNTPHEEWDPFITADGSMIFWASDRDGGFGGTDLYISTLNKNSSKWNTPINLGPNINSNDYEVAPRLTPDEKFLFFDRPIDGTQDIYWVSTTFLDEMRK